MSKRVPPRPTDGELSLLKVLWRRGPSTVREVLDELSAQRRAGYTTVLKLLQIMHAKGLVQRDERRRPHVYRARWSEEQTLDRLLADLVHRAFDGSASKLVLRALAAKQASPEELDRVKRLLDEITEDEE